MKVTLKPDSQMPPKIPGPISTNSICENDQTLSRFSCESLASLVTSPRAPPGEKRSGERSRISWAYYSKVVRTNEIARSVNIT